MAKISYFHQPLTTPLEYRTLPQLLDVRAAEHPDKEAIALYDETRKRSRLTFGEYQDQSRALAAALLEKGLGRGDRVAIMSPNNMEYVISMMALLRIGANVINIIQGCTSDDIIDIMKALKCAGLLCFVDEDQVQSKPARVAIHEMFTIHKPNGDLPVLREVVMIGSSVECESSRDYIHSYSALLSSGRKLEKAKLKEMEKRVQFDDDAFLLLTSGSTGVPKAVQYTHQSLVTSSITTGQLMRATNDSRVYNDSPFTWAPAISSGLALASVMGCTVVFIPPVVTVRDRSVEFLLSVLQEEKVTSALLMPYHLYDLAANEESVAKYDLSHVLHGVVGGQPAPKALTNKIFNLLPNLKLVLYYAATEFMKIASQVVDKNNADTLPYGWMEPRPGVEMKIVGADGGVLPVGAIGEVHVRGPMVFQEYLENPEATARSFSRTRWYNSLDMGEMNEKGLIKIYGRKGDAINRATDTFYPAEYEKIMVQHPLVAQVQMVGVPDQRLYEEMCACVVLKEHKDLESKRTTIEKWYDEQWPPNTDGLSWKPGYTIFLETLPRTRTNKPDRRALKRLAMERLGLSTKN